MLATSFLAVCFPNMKHSYQCSSHKAKQCATKEVRADRLNLIVAQQLAEFFFREDRLKDWEDLLRSDIRDDPENKSLKNRIKGIDKKMENILQNLEDVVSKALTKRLDELTRKKEELENKLKKFTNVPTKLTTNDIRKYKTRFIQLLMNEDIPEARQFLKNTIKKIIVYNNKITVTFNLKTINENLNYPLEISSPSERCCRVLLKPRKPLKIRQFIHAKAL